MNAVHGRGEMQCLDTQPSEPPVNLLGMFPCVQDNEHLVMLAGFLPQSIPRPLPVPEECQFVSNPLQRLEQMRDVGHNLSDLPVVETARKAAATPESADRGAAQYHGA